MKIAFVTPEFITETNFDGGLSNFLNRVTLTLSNMGHEPIVIVSSTKNEEIFRNGLRIFRVKIPTHNPKETDSSLSRKLNGFRHIIGQSLLLNRKLLKIHMNSPVDIVQYPNIEGVGLFKLPLIKSVVRVSSYTPLTNKAYGQVSGKQTILFEELSIRRADRIYCPSSLIAQVVQEKLNRPVQVIPPPFFIDALQLDPSIYLTVLKDKKYLLFFGTIGVLKGVDTIADIIFELLDKYSDLHFVFVGKQFDSKFNNMTMMEWVCKKANNHSNRIVYLGKLQHDQLYPIIQNAISVVLPSKIDNFPNACLEAMAFERVVVGTYGTSFEEIIQNEYNGFLCQPGSPVQLLECVEKVLALSDSERRKVGSRAKAKIEQLSPETVVNQLIDFYEETLYGKYSKRKHS